MPLFHEGHKTNNTTHLPGVGHVSSKLGAIVYGRNQETIEGGQQDQRQEGE